uniref:Uncharacterized protein n=1 Tax=Pararge aegeria TaxID=116150 RepID=S4PG28_9NEOP
MYVCLSPPQYENLQCQKCKIALIDLVHTSTSLFCLRSVIQKNRSIEYTTSSERTLGPFYFVLNVIERPTDVCGPPQEIAKRGFLFTCILFIIAYVYV